MVEAEANRHHQGHLHQVTIIVRVTDEEFVVGAHHRNEDIMVALQGSNPPAMNRPCRPPATHPGD